MQTIPWEQIRQPHKNKKGPKKTDRRSAANQKSDEEKTRLDREECNFPIICYLLDIWGI